MIYNQLGTTFSIEWPINIEDSDKTLSEMNLTLYVSHNRFHKQMEIVVQNNTISFVFEGKDQRVCGSYDIELYVNEGLENQVLITEKNVFNLYK